MHHYHHPANPHAMNIHKGYAFVPFAAPFDGRSACLGPEDGRNVFGPLIDLNLMQDPKNHPMGKKRHNFSKNIGECYNQGNGGVNMGPPPRFTPPMKRPRMMVPLRQQQQRAHSPKKVVLSGCDDLRTYSSPDVLLCGNCRELFSNLADFIEHRKQYCKLRFTCKCSYTAQTGESNEESAALMCALCKENFGSSWDLMVHAQAAHMVNIYQLSNKEANSTVSDGDQSTNPSCSKDGENRKTKTEEGDDHQKTSLAHM